MQERGVKQKLMETEEYTETEAREPLRRPVRPVPNPEPQRKMRIKNWMGWALIISAFCVDVIELIGGYLSAEIIAIVVGFIASFTFWVWFLILEVPYSSNTKRFAMVIITNLGENIPGLDAVPYYFLWTLGMIMIVGMVKMEDKGEKPSYFGGLIEGLASTPSPVAAALLKPLSAERRFIKRSLRVGQADWVEQERERKKGEGEGYLMRKKLFGKW